MAIYHHTFTVEGRGEFPHDMLRYDTCFPADGESAANLYYHVGIRESRRRVKLVQVTIRKRHSITAARWDSFGWLVVKADPETVR